MKTVEELEKDVEGLADLIRQLILKIGKQDRQIVALTNLFEQLLNKTEKKKEGN